MHRIVLQSCLRNHTFLCVYPRSSNDADTVEYGPAESLWTYDDAMFGSQTSMASDGHRVWHVNTLGSSFRATIEDMEDRRCDFQRFRSDTSMCRTSNKGEGTLDHGSCRCSEGHVRERCDLACRSMGHRDDITCGGLWNACRFSNIHAS